MNRKTRHQEGPIVLRFSHVAAAHTPKGKAAQYFSEEVARASGGEVRIDVYPNSMLYKDGEELEALQLGTVDIIAPSLSKLASIGLNGFAVFDLPFLFSDYDSLHEITDGPIGRKMLKQLDHAGLAGKAFWDNGFKNMSATRPLLEVKDFDRLRMRIQPSKIIDLQMRLLGARTEDIALADLRDALANRLVDGCENPPSNFLTQNLSSVQPYMTLSRHGYLGNLMLVNSEFWAQLPRHVRSLLDDCIDAATRYANSIAKVENEQALGVIAGTRMTTIVELSERQRSDWKRTLAPVYKQITDPVSLALLEKVRRRS
jgi:C4-dicarboxylate-binding protein DctP